MTVQGDSAGLKRAAFWPAWQVAWDTCLDPPPTNSDMSVLLHSINAPSCPPAHRGLYLISSLWNDLLLNICQMEEVRTLPEVGCLPMLFHLYRAYEITWPRISPTTVLLEHVNASESPSLAFQVCSEG